MIIRRQVHKQTTKAKYGMGTPRPSRTREQEDADRLCEWVQRWNILPGLPNYSEALARKHISR